MRLSDFPRLKIDRLIGMNIPAATIEKINQSLKFHDLSTYYATLFYPQNTQIYLRIIEIINRELQRIPYKVNEPLAGEIRLQWWQEVINGEREIEASGHPSASLVSLICNEQPVYKKLLTNLISSHRFPLYQEKKNNWHDYETQAINRYQSIYEIRYHLTDNFFHDKPNTQVDEHFSTMVKFASIATAIFYDLLIFQDLSFQEFSPPPNKLKDNMDNGLDKWTSYEQLILKTRHYISELCQSMMLLPPHRHKIIAHFGLMDYLLKTSLKKKKTLEELTQLMPIIMLWQIYRFVRSRGA